MSPNSTSADVVIINGKRVYFGSYTVCRCALAITKSLLPSCTIAAQRRRQHDEHQRSIIDD